MNQTAERLFNEGIGVLHVRSALPPPEPVTAPPRVSCARCGAPVSDRAGTRFCSSQCRKASVRERRAAARADLVAALAQLAEVNRRVESALRTLGLHPTKPRARGRSEP